MKKSYIVEASLQIKASCGKKGCDINLYILPHAGTKELFKEYSERLAQENREENKKDK